MAKKIEPNYISGPNSKPEPMYFLSSADLVKIPPGINENMMYYENKDVQTLDQFLYHTTEMCFKPVSEVVQVLYGTYNPVTNVITATYPDISSVSLFVLRIVGLPDTMDAEKASNVILQLEIKDMTITSLIFKLTQNKTMMRLTPKDLFNADLMLSAISVNGCDGFLLHSGYPDSANEEIESASKLDVYMLENGNLQLPIKYRVTSPEKKYFLLVIPYEQEFTISWIDGQTITHEIPSKVILDAFEHKIYLAHVEYSSADNNCIVYLDDLN